MEINVRNDSKIVEIWLSRAEKPDPSLAPLYAWYRGRGYTVAVYRSGGEELYGLTAGLLVYGQKSLTHPDPRPT